MPHVGCRADRGFHSPITNPTMADPVWMPSHAKAPSASSCVLESDLTFGPQHKADLFWPRRTASKAGLSQHLAWELADSHIM
jgi:hypothetical protein